jgi:hypothetical protein
VCVSGCVLLWARCVARRCAVCAPVRAVAVCSDVGALRCGCGCTEHHAGARGTGVRLLRGSVRRHGPTVCVGGCGLLACNDTRHGWHVSLWRLGLAALRVSVRVCVRALMLLMRATLARLYLYVSVVRQAAVSCAHCEHHAADDASVQCAS